MNTPIIAFMDFTNLEYFFSDKTVLQSTENVSQSNAAFPRLYNIMSKM